MLGVRVRKTLRREAAQTKAKGGSQRNSASFRPAAGAVSSSQGTKAPALATTLNSAKYNPAAPHALFSIGVWSKFGYRLRTGVRVMLCLLY